MNDERELQIPFYDGLSDTDIYNMYIRVIGKEPDIEDYTYGLWLIMREHLKYLTENVDLISRQ